MGYPVPVSVQQTAKRALALRQQYGRGGTEVGIGTAQRLARGGSVSFEFVKKVSEYFPRHAGDRLDDPTSNGSIAWGLWGGDAGRRWSEGVMAKTAKANPAARQTQVSFTVDKNGKPRAYRVSMSQMRHFPIGYDEAKLLVSTGQAKQVPYRPFGKPTSESNPKVVISELVKRITQSAKMEGANRKGKEIDPSIVEGLWKRHAVIHGVNRLGAPVQKMLREDYETAFWQGAARGLANPTPEVTDRALRYRANANPPAGPKQCLFCGSKKHVEVGHLDGHEENNKPENLVWNCRSCNTALGAAFKKLGIGRRTRQYNPAGAETLGQWLNAVQSAKGDPGGTMELDAAVDMIRYTSPVKRSEFAREIWAKRRQAYGPTGRRNPEAPAADMYEKFHGKPSERVDVVEESVHYHEHLAGLGQLISLKIKTPTKIRAELTFAGADRRKGEPVGADAPLLCCSEDGKQLYIVGGNQEVDMDQIDMGGKEWLKDSMNLGEILVITYRTQKGFHNFEEIDYFHSFSEESGNPRPVLLYDTRNKSLSVSGGSYTVKDVGIVD